MAQDERVDPLDPFNVDALLREELSCAPSADFLPRVRNAVRGERVSTRRWWNWTPLPLAAAATLAVALWPLVEVVNPPNSPSAPLVVFEESWRTPVFRFTARPRQTDHGLRPTVHGPRATTTEPSPPEVIVDERQRAALLSFIRLANEGHLTQEAFKHTTPPPVEIADDVLDIVMSPVAVSPILAGGVLHFDVGRN